jgi:hypothetical protein
MTDELNLQPVTPPAEAGSADPHRALAERIIAEAAKQNVKAEIKINQIPAHIAANIREFRKRVELKGMEAIAWGEAYSFMQQHAPPQGQPMQQHAPPQGQPMQQNPPGVPFGGLKK